MLILTCVTQQHCDKYVAFIVSHFCMTFPLLKSVLKWRCAQVDKVLMQLQFATQVRIVRATDVSTFHLTFSHL